MAVIAVLLILAGCIAYLYLKSTLVKSLALVIITVCSAVVALAYFETLANVFISRGTNNRFARLAPWAQTLSFVLLFVLAFAILRTILGQVIRREVHLGLLPERIGRVVCGILLALLLAGVALTALAMAPLPNKYPYQRFAQNNPNTEKLNRALLNADGFVTGWFSLLSRGSFSGKKSFAMFHPDFISQLYLNRHNIDRNVPVITDADAIKVPNKQAVWPAPKELKDSTSQTVATKTGRSLTLVRVGFTPQAIRAGGTFTSAQLRLVCKEKNKLKNPLHGKGQNAYPIGYLKTANLLQEKRLNDSIRLESADLQNSVRWIDFAFYVPRNMVPVLLEFKQNAAVVLPAPVSAEQAPEPVRFIPSAQCTEDIATLHPAEGAKIYGVQLAAGSNLLAGLAVPIGDPNQWRNSIITGTSQHSQFSNEKLTCARAWLTKPEPEQKQTQDQPQTPQFTNQPIGAPSRSPRKAKKASAKSKNIQQLLSPLAGFKLLSLQCNTPPAGTAISGEQLPVLIDLAGRTHHAAGAILAGKLGEKTIYELQYCSVIAESTSEGLQIARDGSVARPFPEKIQLPEQAEQISHFYLLYLVKSGRNSFITGVRPADADAAASFTDCQAFRIR